MSPNATKLTSTPALTGVGPRVEIRVDGTQEPALQTRVRGDAADGVKSYEVSVGQAEPHRVRIERKRTKSGDTFSAFVDGWPVESKRSAEELQGAVTSQAELARRWAGVRGRRFRSRVSDAEQKADTKQPRKPWGRSAWWRIPTALFLVGLCAWGLGLFIRNQLNDASLTSHGKEWDAEIMGIDHETDVGDFIWVFIPACRCQVRLDTVNPAAHPAGSYVLVLYDTTNPTNARPLVDGDSTLSDWGSDVFLFAMALIGLLLVYVMARPELGQLRRWMRRDGPVADKRP